MRAFGVTGIALLVISALSAPHSYAQNETGSKHIKSGARVFIEKMDGFEDYLTAAFHTKRVPVEIVTDRAQAEFTFSGNASGNGKHERATVKAINRDGVVVYAFAFDEDYTLHGKRSAAEACAKNLKKDIFEH